ncbi:MULTISPECIES: glycine cleavage system protein R [Shewanella]|jgi:glycine cleavage system regulatory protein|uniref:Glycine cleavage system transcriptional repressor n=2 Tax=Shewanella frigidimarina TaxID=56812 RepID=Q084V6_SHEFN|nr:MULTISPECIES: ACT domain-containing protein [Shewanella]ABI71209.1 ACT domain protein [Shewanella frigidimarina NCIMB 400]KVX00390.1 amino acid-binding protein [Shewanella frigidimarina]MBB1363571.1 amino acid-binding protein [Shewanella sp. SR44-4]MBB1426684.1 amino acid-binding protein [Shewanella sp. SG44-2]MBO1894919.1 amino acid-binding protein [Shewanella sp. BF02_Schw]|tara:strand:- start:690 stop:1196 length:507 start_codon:yes stop_codon:yes gene_type:complete
MMRYLITLQAPDRKGLVEQIANVVSRHGGNWLDSEMRHIDGIFAAILQLEVPALKWDELIDALECIDGLTLTFAKTTLSAKPIKHLHYNLVAYDRPGIVLHISNKMNALGVNIEQFSSQYETASHTGIALFRATMALGLTDPSQEEQITASLYEMGDDVVLDKLSKSA